MLDNRSNLRKIELFQANTQRNQNTFSCFARSQLENMVLFYGQMFGVSKFKAREQFIQNAFISFIFFPNLGSIDHLHYHRKVLFLGWSFKDEIQNQCLKKCSFCPFPKWIITRCALWRCISHKIGNELQHILFITKIGKGVISMATIGIDKVKHSDFISFLFQKIACVSQDFALGVKHYKRGVGLHNVRFGIEACFTCTRAADNHDVQIAPMLFSVKTYPCVLCQKNIIRPILIRIFSGENGRCTPFCRAMFFSLSVVMLSRKVYADRNAIYQKKEQNCLW